jgi:MFS family permease
VGAAHVGAPLDEEAIGKAGAPERTGLPRDPANARSKKLCYTAVLVAGFALAIDFTMSLMSIQPLFYLLEGPQSLYGLTFGCYDLTAMLFAPLFGLWTDRTRRFKPQIMFGSMVNAAGNLLYAFTVLAGQWWIMLVSRLVAGVGAATLGLGSSYITQTTTSAQRQVKLGRRAGGATVVLCILRAT